MKKIKFLTAALILLTSTTAAQAETGFYAGVDYSFQELNIEGAGSVDFGSLGLTGGYKFNEFFAAEARLSGGANDEDIGGGASIGLDSYVGLQGVVTVPLANGLSAYGTLGYGTAEIALRADNVSLTESDDSVSYGVGAQFDLNKQVGLRVGYDSVYDKDGVQIDGFKLQALYRF